jgi:hypothetical protein
MHDWYQVEAWATVDVFIKKADPANVQVTFSAKNLNVAVKLPTGSAYKWVSFSSLLPRPPAHPSQAAIQIG